MGESEIQGFHNVIFVHEGGHHLLELLLPQEHIETQLESRLIVVGTIWLVTFGPELNQESGKFEAIRQYMELQHLVEHHEVFRVVEVLNYDSLQRWLERNLILQDASEELQ